LERSPGSGQKGYTRTEDQLVDEPKSLNSIFKEKLFRVPDYQRGYAVAGHYELGVEVGGKPFAEEGHSKHETSAPIPRAEWLAFSFTSRRACCRR
jgi:hypothetical protein